MSESQDATPMVATPAVPDSVTDSKGRVLTLRKMGALAKLRMFKACGLQSSNEPYLGMAMLACYITAIDGVPVPMPINETQIEAAVSRAGDEGIEAVAKALEASTTADPAGEMLASGE